MQKNDFSKDSQGNKRIDIPSFMNSSNDREQLPDNQHDYYEEDDSGAFIKEVNSSLAKQVSDDFYDDKPDSNRRRKKKKSSKILKAVFFTLLSLTAVCCLLLFTKSGQKIVMNVAGDYIYGKLDYQPSQKVTEAGKNEAQTIPKEVTKVESHIVNILLIGVEQFENAQNTDSMIIATMNTKNHTLKLTSLMRDLYVQIPGYKDNRLNAAYGIDGIELLYDTIELNFGIRMDGYALVNFDAFEKIIDMIGGVEITLNSKEVTYLRTTNYISHPEERDVVEGSQVMTGNQALGYCRIRKVTTGTENDDFGRTQRQRIVLNAIYDKLKSKNILQLALLMNDILNQVPIITDIEKEDFKNYLEEAVNLKVNEIENFRIPSNGSFENVKVQLGKSTKKQEVLQVTDWDATREELHDFIYGTEADIKNN
jgi:polyisoprenyl-teichoic acid--peptidoglycan teichoic acid transferase